MTATETRPAPPAPPPRPPGWGSWLLGLARGFWRQLTSMRTALVLLFLLAVASIPGSVLPQSNVAVEQVQNFYRDHPTLAPWVAKVGGFDVFGSAWFAAIYLLLFTSLIGCVLPRLRDHYRAIRSRPPNVPARLDRLPHHETVADFDGDVAQVAAALRKQRWRVVVRDDTVSAEKGYLKETGNLLFHFSLIAVLVAVALGSWYGWHGNRILVAGKDSGFCNSLQQYDESKLGPRVDDKLQPFCLTLDDFKASFQTTGQPKEFRATVTVEGDGPTRTDSFSVNDPLRLDGASVYLLGHGYAPILRYTDRFGKAQTKEGPFLSEDEMQTSSGAISFPDANVDPATGLRDPNLQMGFDGLYLPTAPDQAPYLRSQFPAENNPALLLTAYRGNLGLDAGIPSSVYRLDQTQIDAGRLKQVGEAKLLKPGESWTLDDGSTVQFVGTKAYAVLSVRHDPGQGIALVASVLALTGLMGSLFGKRRRVFFRLASPSPTSSSRLLEAGGLPRTDYPGFAEEFASTVAAVREKT
ncbi:cytochrome c biogenesis protein ResB [Asanoa sp. WMMD1127]|uniref:cytochrome c biogenesis protein ResB n=1 Tax=Asanoa sp. WMMD1127 TaxID=3016107 RepID=UPI0024166D4D|nr:cytochrome c biogenesis protein ResB [Asanoa sp. WMMD1127]MDG4821662.1 cytochrome c biogenesis protein ResB [Asanoa sp. WMMD1127]